MSLPDPSPSSHVVVTGASSGIGTELARVLAARGHALALVARRADRLQDLADELGGVHGVAVTTHACDLGDAAQRGALIDALLNTDAPTIAALCNNAGFGAVGKSADIGRERQVELARLNVEAPLELTAAVLPGMLERGAGAILNVASVAAAQPIPGFAAYAASKAFVAAYSEAVHAEVAGTGVSVTTLSPGPVRTEFGERAGAKELNAGPSFLYTEAAEVARQAVTGMVEGKRTVTPSVAMKVGAIGGRLMPRGPLRAARRRGAPRRHRSA